MSRIMDKHNLVTYNTGDSSESLTDNIKRALVSGFFMQSAHFERKGNYMTIMDNQIVRLHPSTGLTRKPEWVVYNEFVMTTNNFIRTVTEINPAWLIEAAPEYYDMSNFADCAAKRALQRLTN